MANTITISAKYFPTIGLIGQSVGFVDFTPAQLASDGYISTLSRSFDFDVKTIMVGITNVTTGKEAVMTQITTDVTAYLDTIFTDVGATYVSKIYVLNVRRLSDAIVGVATDDLSSAYVDRDDIYYADVRINVSVA